MSDGGRGSTPESPSPTVGTKEVQIVVIGSDGASRKFILPGVDGGFTGDASVFELEDGQLVNAMKSDSYTVSFDVGGWRQEYDVYQHADAPLVPRLQLVEAWEFENEEQQQAFADIAQLQTLPWASPEDQDSTIMTRRFTSSPIDENDVLSAGVQTSEASEGQYEVLVKVSPEAAKRMATETKRMVEQTKEDKFLRLAILVDGKVAMAPRVMSVLSNSFVITGDFDKAEIEKLASSIAN